MVGVEHKRRLSSGGKVFQYKFILEDSAHHILGQMPMQEVVCTLCTEVQC